MKKLSVLGVAISIGLSTAAAFGRGAWDRIICPWLAALSAPPPQRLALTLWAQRFRHPASAINRHVDRVFDLSLSRSDWMM